MSLHVHCTCGAVVGGDTEDELVDAVQAHKAEAHPEITEEWSREQILSMAHDSSSHG
jgi:predicted small metal-binding protein